MVKCWGANNEGQLGDGTIVGSSVPQEVPGISAAVAISTSVFQTCVIISGGTVECWGNVNPPRPHPPGFPTGSTPQPVSGINSATAIAAGGDHACAILSGGTVQCWGYNSYGQLGNGTTSDAFTSPVTVSGITNAVALSLGSNYSCALLSGRTIQCWGDNKFGQLGDGTGIDSTIPVTVSGISNATAISAAGAHACARLQGGAMKCWGDNIFGQLGDGSTATESLVPVTVAGGLNAQSVSTGEGHTCAVVVDGTIQCWGIIDLVQFAYGFFVTSSTPVPVSGINTAEASSGSATHNCVLLVDGAVNCWGYNAYGTLGDGTLIDSASPVTVTGIPKVVWASSNPAAATIDPAGIAT
ncbi:MAG TPA: hypothetical protein VLB09_06395, partial [Nitrospiria bacterium]|nr:hypothetical protein [Nitrospiria bacterium]